MLYLFFLVYEAVERHVAVNIPATQVISCFPSSCILVLGGDATAVLLDGAQDRHLVSRQVFRKRPASVQPAKN